MDELSERYRSIRDASVRGAIGPDKAVAEMRVLSEKGYSRAKVFVGLAYEVGRGVPIDLDAARRWYQAAADSGDQCGQLYLGNFLINHGDPSGGIGWIENSAAQGYAPALYTLGRIYDDGVWVCNDAVKGRAYMEAAAAARHPFARRWLAAKDLKGDRGLRGVLKGVMWIVFGPLLMLPQMLKRPEILRDPEMWKV